uniref:Glycine receptor beta n=1 Tax=Oncorhynchus tshawytscha TaxID=74940 RepID=A0A8C8JLY9_ONCTS
MCYVMWFRVSFLLLCRQLTPEDLARVPENTTSNILNRLLIIYDPRIRPNFKGIPVEDEVNIFINSCGSIQETSIVRLLHSPKNKAFMCKWKKQLQETDDNSIYLHNCGSAFSVPRLSVTLSCPLDLTLFPMDTQRCKMQLESFGYTTDDLQFMWQSGDPVQMEEIALPQFDIKQEDIEYGNCTKFYAGAGYYTCVEVIFTLRRQVGFYMMRVYAPTLLIMVLSWLSFWINPDASAARVPLGILSVLSLSSECTSLASELPKVSYVKAIDVCLIACLLFGFVMLNSPKRIEAEKAKMASKAKGKEKAAGRNNTVNGTSGTPCHVSMLQVGETRCKKVCTSKSDLRTNDFSIVGSLPQDFDLSNFDCQETATAQTRHPLDLYARALFPFSFLFFNITYWSVYL